MPMNVEVDSLHALDTVTAVEGWVGPSMKRGRALGVPILSDFVAGAADHTAAMQDMMTYCRTNGVKAAMVDDGTWTIDETIVLDINDFHFFGSGLGSKIQLGSGMPNQTAVLETVSGTYGVEVSHLRIKGIGSSNTHPFGVHGWPNSYNMLVHHVVGEDLGYYGAVDFSQCNRSIMHSCIALRCRRGFTSSGDTNNYGTTIAQCIAEDCHQGVSVESGRGVRVVNNYVLSKTAGLYGIDESGCDGTYIAGNEVYRTFAGTFYPFITGLGDLGRTTTTHAKRNKIIGNTFRGGTTIFLQILEDSLFAFNTVEGMTGWGVTVGDALAIDSSRRNRFTSNIVVGGLGFNEARGVSNRFDDNDLSAVTGNKFSTSLGSNSRARRNEGYVTENSGASTVPSGNTFMVVNHGLTASPGNNLSLLPTNNLGNATRFWVSNVGNSTFQINLDVDPGASGAAFSWRAQRFL
jgi:hypothetical protein